MTKQPIEYLLHEVLEIFPTTLSSVDYPKDPNGWWWLDLVFQNRRVVVMWNVKEGYLGVSLATPETAYGEKPDWVSPNPYKALAQVLSLMAFGNV